MTVINVQKDPDRLTFSITAEFGAPTERVWQLWADARQLERWWGPPTYPATFLTHDLTQGGKVTYYMTGPEGDQMYGLWRVLAVVAPNRLEFEDWFSDAEGNPKSNMPTTMATVTIGASGSAATHMTISTLFPSMEAMNQLIEMGMEQGMTLAIGQIDALLAETVKPGVGA